MSPPWKTREDRIAAHMRMKVDFAIWCFLCAIAGIVALIVHWVRS